jgi:hypothetical protein
VSVSARSSTEQRAVLPPAGRRLPKARAALPRRPLDSLPPAWTLTAALGALYVAFGPVSTDLAAAGYRSELFSRAGFTLWDNGWYAGHHLLAYSVLAPGLGALIGTQLLGAISMTVAAALFGVLVDGRYAPRASRAATIAKLWFAFGAAAILLANRIAFDLGVCIGLGALAAAQAAAREDARHRRLYIALALVLALLCGPASPVAAAFLALATAAWAIANGSPQSRGTFGSHSLDQRAAPRGMTRVFGLALAVVALAPVMLLELAFPEGGTQPFEASAFYPTLAAVLALAVILPPREHVLRMGAVLYALTLIAAYAIPTAVGGNADRLGSLFAGPLIACALVGRHPASRPSRAASRRTWALLLLAPALLYWQVKAPVGDFFSALGDPAAQRSYFTPLLTELERLELGYGERPARIEVVPSRDHAEARWVGARVSLARGWERQLDTERNTLFYGAQAPSTARYERWLDANAVSYVALPDAPLDYSAEAEGRLVGEGQPYLREVWRSPHWRLFAVAAPGPLAQPPSALTQLGDDSFTLRAPRAGSYVVRVHFTPYWSLARGHGCVRRAAGDWTTVQPRAAETVRVAIDFSLARVFADGPRCR